MEYREILKRLLEEFEKGKKPLKTKGIRGYGYGTIYSPRNPAIYGESEAKAKAREEEKKKKRKYRLNKKRDKKVDISKAFKEEEITLNELKKLIRSILYEK